MALPRLETATYELTIPSTGKKIEYRPFLVKEEKALLIAAEDGSPATITKAMKDIITACTEGEVKLKELASFDIEYIFLQLRGKSVGDIIEINLQKPDRIKCEEEVCPNAAQISVDIRDIVMNTSDMEKPEIELTEDVGVKLNFPQIDTIQKYVKTGGTLGTEDVFKMIIDCIEYIWDGDEIYKSKDSTKKELNDFIESLSTEQFNKIRKYFESMPRLTHEITWTCPKCEKSAPLVLEGLDSFFG
ncbi:MAG: baseplate protein [Chloroflexi bacterium]|nr:baseplate protein [Chloroflexota bacterium]|tara:strand:+ start:815 stop:1549 length:735 start_codon:yes stop_codon:yes gene_type:complete